MPCCQLKHLHAAHPFEVRRREGAEEARQDHGDVGPDDPQGVADRQRRHEDQIQQQQRRRDEPVCDVERQAGVRLADRGHVGGA